MLRMRSVRSQPVAPSSVAPANPAPVSLRKSLREVYVTCAVLTKQERTTQRYVLQAGQAVPVNPTTLATPSGLLESFL